MGCSIYGQTLAFPGAEGFGKYAKGGRGGDVYHVTNLDDDGIGSFRYGVENMNGPRTIVFDVSGTIMLDSDSSIKVKDDYLTIAGQTAPGEGITIGGASFIVQSSHVIVRYVRFRLGDLGVDDDDTVSIVRGSNIIFDHVTASWSIDETFSCQSDEVNLLTVQWCMITESLNYSHHEKGNHGYGGIIGSLQQTFHHNLYAHHASRSPKVTWRQHTKVDFRNNVIYNWNYNNCYDGSTSYINWVNNYYKYGPATNTSVKNRIFQLSDEDAPQSSSFETSLYADGNYVDGYPIVTANNWSGGIDLIDGASESKNRIFTPHDFISISNETAESAYTEVVEKAGASIVRDVVDARIANEVLSRTATYSGVESNLAGIIDSQSDVGGWPALIEETRPAQYDTDLDGMPDTWETQNGLNPNNPNDRNEDANDDGYTNLEDYLNGIINVLSVKEKTDINQDALNFYPNPADDFIYIDLRKLIKPHLKLYNFLGQKVYDQEANQGINKISLETLKDGIYLLQVESSDGNKSTLKLIKQ